MVGRAGEGDLLLPKVSNLTTLTLPYASMRNDAMMLGVKLRELRL